jgi:hypothetical protein
MILLPAFAILVAILGCASRAPHAIGVCDDHIAFRLSSPAAKSVSVVVIGQTVQNQPARREKNGDWVAEVSLNAKEPVNDLRYFYLVNGAAYLPPCPMKDSDDFGAENCVLSAAEIIKNRDNATW